MNQHLAKSSELYESNNVDFHSFVGWHLCYGIVVCTPDAFALGFHIHSDNLEEAVTFEGSDTLYVTMCSGDMRSALEPFKDKYKYIAFRRGFKGSERDRLFNMNKFYSKL